MVPIAHLRENKDEKSKDFMHQSIPPAPSTPGLFARLLSPGGGAFANFALPGGRVFATPGPLVSFSHSRSFLSEYNYTEALTEKKKNKTDWLTCQGRKKLKRVVKACSRFYVNTKTVNWCMSSRREVFIRILALSQRKTLIETKNRT